MLQDKYSISSSQKRKKEKKKNILASSYMEKRDYQSEFSLDLLSMLVDIESFTCPCRGYSFNEAFWKECR